MFHQCVCARKLSFRFRITTRKLHQPAQFSSSSIRRQGILSLPKKVTYRCGSSDFGHDSDPLIMAMSNLILRSIRSTIIIFRNAHSHPRTLAFPQVSRLLQKDWIVPKQQSLVKSMTLENNACPCMVCAQRRDIQVGEARRTVI